MVAIPIPYAKTSVTSGLGVMPPENAGECVIIGSCTLSVAGTLSSFRGSDTAIARSQLGKGDAVEALVRQCLDSQGHTTHFYKITPTTPGASSAVAPSGGGPTVTVTGLPHSSANVVIKVVRPGAIGTAAVQISYDGGDTFGEVTAIAATLVSETGETQNFAAGTYVLNETYSYTNTAPAPTSGDLATACDAVTTHPTCDPEFWRISGFPATASDAATIATMLAAKITTAELAGKFPIVVIEMPPVDKATIATAFAAFQNDWMIACGGFCELVNPTTGRVEKRPSSFVLIPRLSRNEVGIDGSRNVNDTDLDPLPGIRVLVPPGSAASTGYHNESATPGLAAARVAHLMSFPGRVGSFGNFLSLAGPTSDFGLIALQRIMRKMQRGMFQWQLSQLNGRIAVKADGRITAGAQRALQDSARAHLRSLMAADQVGEIVVVVDGTNNIRATGKVIVTVGANPPAYGRGIEATMAYAVEIPAQ